MEDNGSDFVRITNREVWSQLRVVESKLDDALRTIGAQQARLDEGDKRIRALELRFYGILAGVVAAIGLLLAGPGGIVAAAVVPPTAFALRHRRNHERKD